MQKGLVRFGAFKSNLLLCLNCNWVTCEKGSANSVQIHCMILTSKTKMHLAAQKSNHHNDFSVDHCANQDGTSPYFNQSRHVPKQMCRVPFYARFFTHHSI